MDVIHKKHQFSQSMSFLYQNVLILRKVWISILFLGFQTFPFTYNDLAGQHIADSLLVDRIKKQTLRFASQQNYDSALYYQRQLKKIYEQHQQWDNLLSTQIDICTYLFQKASFTETLSSLEEGFNLAKQLHISSPKHLIELHNLSGVLHFHIGDYEKALAHMKQSLSSELELKEQGNPQYLATRYNNIAAIVSRMGDYEESIFYYQKSLSLRKTYGSALEIGESYNNLSISYYRKKEFESALDYQKQYLAILNKVSNKENDRLKDYITCYNSLGVYYTEVKNYEKALHFLNKALKLHDQTSYFLERTYHNLGYVYRVMGDNKQALTYLNKALQLNQKKYKTGHPDIGKEYRHLGVISHQEGQLKQSLIYYQLSLQQLVEGFADTAFTSNPSLAAILSKPDLLRTLNNKGMALREWSIQTKNKSYLKASLDTYILGVKLIEEMRSEYNSENGRQFANEEALPVYAGALETIYLMMDSTSEKLFEYAFSVFEKSKALLLIESLQRKKNQDSYGVPDSLLVKEQKINTLIGFHEKQLIQAVNQHDSVKEALSNQYLSHYQDQHHQLLKLFSDTYPNYARNRNLFAVTTLKNTKAFLTKNETCLIEYFLSSKTLWIMLITPDTIQFLKKDVPEKFYTWLSDYQKSLTDQEFITNHPIENYQTFTYTAHSLYQFLLGDVSPVINRYKQPKLLIVPHLELASVPFESLLEKPASNSFQGFSQLPYLIKKWDISYAYSTSLQMELTHYSSSESSKLLAFGPQFFNDHNLPDLPYVETELKSIQKEWDGKFLLNNDALKVAFQQQASQYGIIHLATHAIMDEINPYNSRIYFASKSNNPEESTLYAYEIANLSLRAELVVLSACETGTGKLAKGEGIMSLGRSFMYAGCKSVIMNLWRSEDKANAALASFFYDFLSQGKTKDHSLRLAKLQYLTNADEFHAHPAFWAGFVLTGDTHPIPQHKNIWILTAGPLLALLLIGIIIYIKRNTKTQSRHVH